MVKPCEDDALAAARLPTRFGEFRILDGQRFNLRRHFVERVAVQVERRLPTDGAFIDQRWRESPARQLEALALAHQPRQPDSGARQRVFDDRVPAQVDYRLAGGHPLAQQQ